MSSSLLAAPQRGGWRSCRYVWSMWFRFDDSPAGQRRLMLFVTGVMLPAGVVFLLAVGRGRPSLSWGVPAAVVLIVAAFLWSFVHRDPKPRDLILPGGIATTLSCAIGFAAGGLNGVAFFGLLGASVFTGAALFDWPTAVAAAVATSIACFVILVDTLGVGLALANAVFFSTVQNVLALVVYRKASGHRAARLRSLERHLNDIELVFLPDGTIADANDRAAQAYGYAREELLGKNVAILYRPDDLVAMVRTLADVAESGSGLFEAEHRRKDGGSFPVEVSARTYSVHGKTYVHGLIRDRTAQRAAEANQRFNAALVANMHEAVITLDLEGRVTSWSPGAERIFGWQSTEVMGRSLLTFLVPSSSAPTTGESQEQFLSAGRWVGVVPCCRKDGRLLSMSVAATELRNEQDRLVGILDVMRDVTEQLAAEEELRRAKEAAEAGTRAKSSFLANMSHEIRTPMNGVLGASELLLSGHLDGDQRQLAETIHGSSRALLNVLNDVLDFSKVEAGQLALESVPFEPEDLVFSVVELFRARLVGGPLDLVVRVSPALPERLLGDPVRLRQVLANLVGNAIKFTPTGRVRVDAEVVPRGETGLTLRLSVADTGIGISAEQRSRLFKPFGQGDSSTVRRFGGTGLGLAISKAYVEAMGGTLAEESSEGSGAVFIAEVPASVAPESTQSNPARFTGRRALVALQGAEARQVLGEQLASLGFSVVEAEEVPLAPDDRAIDVALCGPEAWAARPGESRRLALCPANARAGELFGGAPALSMPLRPRLLAQAVEALLLGGSMPLPSAAPQALASPPPLPNLRVLVAEDNPVNQMIVRRLLEAIGAQVEVVGNGQEAVLRLAKERFDLVFMDCQMPVMDGYSAVRAIRVRERAEGGHQAIVALTASALAEERSLSMEAGMDDHLAKPVCTAVLRAAIERWALRGSSSAS